MVELLLRVVAAPPVDEVKHGDARWIRATRRGIALGQFDFWARRVLAAAAASSGALYARFHSVREEDSKGRGARATRPYALSETAQAAHGQPSLEKVRLLLQRP